MSKLSNNISSTILPQISEIDLAGQNFRDRAAFGPSASYVGVELEFHGAQLPNMKAGSFSSIQTPHEDREYPVVADMIGSGGPQPRTVTIAGSRLQVSFTNLPEFSGPEKVSMDSANTVSLRGSSTMGNFVMHSTHPVEVKYNFESGHESISGERASIIDVRGLSQKLINSQAA